MKKKILMQVRDQKTLAVDTCFPLVLIMLGMYLATIVLLKSGVPRDMDVSGIYPTETFNIFYNNESPYLKTEAQ